MQSYTYLLINFCTIIICFLFSFHPAIRFDRYFLKFLLGATMVAIPFLIWDAWFTSIGVWWFNEDYTIGTEFYQLPLEEILFFICIPFSCIFTYYVITKFVNITWETSVETKFVLLFSTACIVISMLHLQRLYTMITFFAAAFSVLTVHFTIRKDLIGKSLSVYLLLLPGFFLVNGVLTGTWIDAPIVNYNADHMLNIRIGTIPVEDSVYGFVLFLWNVVLFEKWRDHKLIL